MFNRKSLARSVAVCASVLGLASDLARADPRARPEKPPMRVELKPAAAGAAGRRTAWGPRCRAGDPGPAIQHSGGSSRHDRGHQYRNPAGRVPGPSRQLAARDPDRGREVAARGAGGSRAVWSTVRGQAAGASPARAQGIATGSSSWSAKWSRKGTAAGPADADAGSSGLPFGGEVEHRPADRREIPGSRHGCGSSRPRANPASQTLGLVRITLGGRRVRR